MIKKYLQHILLAALFISKPLFAQNKNWTTLLDEGASFKEVQNAFYKEWEGKDYESGKGHVQFKRWEYYWSSRLMPDGSFPPANYLAEAYHQEKKKKKYRSTGDSYWTSIGPNNSAAYGVGRINVVAVDPNNSNIVYAGAPGGGVWKSINGGNSWTVLNDFMPVIGVSAIAIDPTNSNVIYIGTGDCDANDSGNDGVYKSIDGGLNWTKTWSVSPAPKIYKMAIDPTNSNIIFVAAANGFYRSVDAGATWTVTQTGSIRDFEFKPGNSQIIYTASTTQLFISNNNGVSFSSTSTGLPSGSSKLLIAVTAADPSYVYVMAAQSAANSYAFGGIYLSANSGTSFTAQNTTTDIFESTQAWYDLAFVASPTNKDMLYSGCLNIWRSVNGGISWTKANNWTNSSSSSYTHGDVHFLGYFNSDLWTGTDGGVYRSSDNALTFIDSNNGLAIGQFYTIAGQEANSSLISGGLQDNGGWHYNGTLWKRYHGGDGMESAIDESNSLYLWGMIQYGGLYHSNNGGISASYKGKPTTDNGNWVTPMVVDPSSDGIIAGYKDLYRYTVTGGWVKLNTVALSSNISKIEVCTSNPNVIYFSNTNLYKSTDGGITYQTLTKPWTELITSIEVNPNNANELWVTVGSLNASNKVFKSMDGGSSWVNISAGLPNISTNIIKYDATSANGGLYVGNDLGVYYRDNINTTWTVFDDNLPNTAVKDLEINESNNLIRAATYGRGVWESNTFPEITTNNKVVNSEKTGISLYPNPSNGMLYVDGALGRYSIIAYNSLGKEVYQKNNEELTNDYRIDISSFPEGLYSFVFISSEQMQSITILKK